MKKRELIINLVLVVAILVMSYLIVTTGMARQRVQKEAAQIQQKIEALGEEILEPETRPVEEETRYVVKADRFKQFGTKRIFDVPIPKPTPSPTPAPTPMQPPPLDAVLANWALQGIMGNKAFIQDKSTGEPPFDLELNGEARMVTSGGFAFMVQLVGIDKKAYSIQLKSDQHPEPHKIEMFPSTPQSPTQ